jgi:hypothetical protein
MNAKRFLNMLTFAGLVTGGMAAFLPTSEAADAAVKANYSISIAGFTIGRADVDADLSNADYTAEISGSTKGLIRLISDSRATLTGNGEIHGSRVLPFAYALSSVDSGLETHVQMAMRGGAVVKVDVDPPLEDAPDRVPLGPSDKRRVVDPLAAFIVAMGDGSNIEGRKVCDRTVPVFDGWQRFDIALFYKETRRIRGRDDSYSGDAVVCGARYVPVAGHRLSRESIQYMAQNKRLEIWLVPVANTDLLLPYRILIGTEIGDLVIAAKSFVVTAAEKHASAE